VVAFESFTTKDTDFSSQLTKIINSGAEFCFTPQYYNEVALIVKQAHELGWNKPIVGSDSWGSAETVALCGKDCYGPFSAPIMPRPAPKAPPRPSSIAIMQKYGYVPDDVGALTWDSLRLVQQAIQNTAI
jgi:branched-chain amino acid transport system substrate-binding protein